MSPEKCGKEESCANTLEWEKTLFKLIWVYLFLVTSFELQVAESFSKPFFTFAWRRCVFLVLWLNVTSINFFVCFFVAYRIIIISSVYIIIIELKVSIRGVDHETCEATGVLSVIKSLECRQLQWQSEDITTLQSPVM